LDSRSVFPLSLDGYILLHCDLGFRLRNPDSPGSKNPDSPEYPESPDFFPEYPGFAL
jgi:hypothetical protein